MKKLFQSKDSDLFAAFSVIFTESLDLQAAAEARREAANRRRCGGRVGPPGSGGSSECPSSGGSGASSFGDEVPPGMNRGVWSEEEHALLLEGVKIYGHSWESVANHIGSRTRTQTRSHAEKFFKRQRKEREAAATAAAAAAVALAADDAAAAPTPLPPLPLPRKAPLKPSMKRPLDPSDRRPPISAAKPRKVEFRID